MTPGELARVLYIDLSEKEHWVEEREDLFSRYLGGSGVAVQLLKENCPKGCDPLSPDNPIILSVGPLTALFPLASKTVAMFKSPLTGNLGESHCGGRSAVAIRLAGYGAVVIKGASESPVYVAVHGSRVYFRDASALWGMRSSYTVGRVIREREPNAGMRTIMRIGRAGEKLVRYACVVAETYRHFGRLGLGAVFGSKKLKALVISGNGSVPVKDRRRYTEVYSQIYDEATRSKAMKKYHDLGTAQNVAPLSELRALPTRNLKSTRFEHAEDISGERLAERFLGRRLACSHCPVGCIHLAALREPYEEEPYFYKTSMLSYDYELIYSLGSMLGVGDAESLLKLIHRVEVLGLDAMSTGVALAWATEALERGIVGVEETLAELKWGDAEAYLEAVNHIVEQPNRFYRTLAAGVENAAEAYGGEEFALAFGRNEMPGYHTGEASVAGYLAGARHSHLDNAGYALDQKLLKQGKKMGAEELARALFSEEAWRQVLSSLVVCFFARGIYTPELVAKALAVAGLELTQEELQRLGEEILKEKFDFKFRESFSFDALRIPERVLETPSARGRVKRELVLSALRSFHRLLR